MASNEAGPAGNRQEQNRPARATMPGLRAVSTLLGSGYLVETFAHSLPGGLEGQDTLNFRSDALCPSPRFFRMLVNVTHLGRRVLDGGLGPQISTGVNRAILFDFDHLII